MKKLANIYHKLRQQTWTHIAMCLYLILSIIAIITIPDIILNSSDIKLGLKSLFNFFSIFSEFTINIIIIFAIVLFYSNKTCNCRKIKNRFMLENKKYNLFWLLGLILTIISYSSLVINKTIFFVLSSDTWEIGRSLYPNWYNKTFCSLIIIIIFYFTFIALEHSVGDNNE